MTYDSIDRLLTRARHLRAAARAVMDERASQALADEADQLEQRARKAREKKSERERAA